MLPEKLILSLIKDHLIYTRLYYGLTSAGLDAEDFTLDLADTIFKVMDLGDAETDRRFSVYLQMADRVTRMDAETWRGRVDVLANELYQKLVYWKSLKTG